MAVSLFDRLEADIGAERADETAIMDSILANLRVLLNSRKGCCEIHPDYGLGSFNGLGENFRNYLAMFSRDVEKQILAYEPRLRNVMLQSATEQTRPMELVFNVIAEISGADKPARVSFESILENNGRMRLTA